ncbi:MAG: methylmalonyl Co-A mutase-associated GTPase MeaB, partial [Verrucomicrobiales bacterium]|nr:methylmalonyl Co-A mutase-associated GTPase MeaB [Verrucomicrobiales bacterium]
MDAYGFSSIVMETVGVGQSEYDVVAAADTVGVVLCPGAGDDIQAMKAGILEVADVLVVNKSDLPGSDLLVADLEEAISMRAFRRNADATEWKVPVLGCSAVKSQGLKA